MNVLEKILEEIERLNEPYFVGYIDKYKVKEIVRSHIEEVLKCGECSRRKWYQKGCEDGKKDNGWIPVEDRLPPEQDSIFAKFKGTSKWDGVMWEKRSDEVNVTYELGDGTRKATTSYTLDGVWKLEKESKVVKKKVVAWQPLPVEYQPKEKDDE